MAVLTTLIILAFVRASTAVSSDVCANCKYNNGVGYIGSPDNCHVFYQCEKKASGPVTVTTMCCPPGTVWLEEHFTCYFGHCNDSYDPCPDKVTTTDYPCPYEPVEGNATHYKVILTWDILKCPDATVYSAEDCACVNGGEKTCVDDPFMYFPFVNHYNDIQCHKVKGTPHGDAELVHLVNDKHHVQLDGDGDYISFGFLANYFAWNKLDHFTVSLWFNQSMDGWDNINNSPVEGLYGNGDCTDDASIWLTFGNEIQQGGLRTNLGSALFEDSGDDRMARDYNPPEQWCQASIRYTKTEVSLFLNGKLTATREISGYVANTFAQSTIGLAILECNPFFWTGGVDDLMIFTRYVSNDEMYENVFSRGRANDEYPYESDFYP